MNDKSNFYVFEKKEVFLVILFVILVSITSFLFGLKMGSGYSFEQAGNTSSDLEKISTENAKVDFSSTEEERVNEFIKTNNQDVKKEDINKKVEESLKQKMIEEFNNENTKKFNPETTKVAPEKKEIPIVEPTESLVSVDNSDSVVEEKEADNFSGKFTIQLGSYQTIKEATEFAEGFKVLGYNPIINESTVAGRGNWFRVSIGVFDNLNDAKSYLLKNKSLFANREYFFFQFD